MTTIPTEIRLTADKKTLHLTFPNQNISLPAELLRVESPSAEVQGHGNEPKKIVTGKEDVTITNLEPQGNYAVKITFSDGHKTGLYTWEYFQELAHI